MHSEVSEGVLELVEVQAEQGKRKEKELTRVGILASQVCRVAVAEAGSDFEALVTCRAVTSEGRGVLESTGNGKPGAQAR